MWPVAVSIIVFIAGYTWINLNFRKEGKAYEPYQAMLDRMKASSEPNMYGWRALRASPAPEAPLLDWQAMDPQNSDQPLRLLVPEEIVYYRHEPKLAPRVGPIELPLRFDAGQPLLLRIDLPKGLAQDPRFHLNAYYKDRQLHVFPEIYADDPQAAQDLSAGPMETAVFAVPGEAIEPGELSVTVYLPGKVCRGATEARPPQSES